MTIEESKNWDFANLLTKMGFKHKIVRKASGYKITVWTNNSETPSPKAIYFRHPSEKTIQFGGDRNPVTLEYPANYALGNMLRMMILSKLGFENNEKWFSETSNPEHQKYDEDYKGGLNIDTDYDDYINGKLY